jgi:hypothetical protein
MFSEFCACKTRTKKGRKEIKETRLEKIKALPWAEANLSPPCSTWVKNA